MKKNQAFSDSRLFDAQILGDQVIPGASNDNNRAYSLTLHSGEELLVRFFANLPKQNPQKSTFFSINSGLRQREVYHYLQRKQIPSILGRT